MHTTTLKKVGGSVMLTIPPALLDVLDLYAGASVGLSIEAGQLIVKATTARRYQLSDLLAQCNPEAPRSDEDEVWLAAPPTGRELL